MIVILTIFVAIIAYFTWRTFVGICRINNLLGVVLDAIFKISSRTDMGVDEIRKTLESVSHAFISDFGVDAYNHSTRQV
jgi:hypothetical protein